MLKFNVRIADTVFEINCFYDYFYNLASDYLTDLEKQCTITITNDDIEYLRKQIEEYNNDAGIEKEWDEGRFESFAILRKVAVYFIDKHTLVFHGAVVCKDEKAYMFVAPSGVGKTTHLKLWLQQFKDACPINGDMPIVIIKDNKICVAGTPWAGIEGLQTNKIVPLKAICLISRSNINKIDKLEDTDLAFSKLYGHIIKFSDKTLSIVKDLKTIIENVDFYSLQCNMDLEAAVISYNGMK